MKTSRWPRWAQRILVVRRRLRIEQALSKVRTYERMRVLDIGCGTDGRSLEDFLPQGWEVTGADILAPEKVHHSYPGFRYVRANAAALGFADNAFDLVVSVGMLEHVTDQTEFEAVASEIRRVGRQHIVIVPWRFALVEPHYALPLFPLFPYWAQIAVIKLLNPTNQRAKLAQDPGYFKKSIRWLSSAEYKIHFPGSSVCVSPTLDTIAIICRD